MYKAVQLDKRRRCRCIYLDLELSFSLIATNNVVRSTSITYTCTEQLQYYSEAGSVM